MDSSGTRTCSNSGSIVIADVSSAKDIILRRTQTVVCLEIHTLISSMALENQRRLVPGAISSNYILNVVFLKINIFTEIL